MDSHKRNDEVDDRDRDDALEQAREAGSGTTGHEVEPESDADMTIWGTEKKKKDK